MAHLSVWKILYLTIGHNTKSKNEQEKYDSDGITVVFRNTMFGMALVMPIGVVISIRLHNPKIEKYALFGAVIILLPYPLIISNSKKHDE